MLVVQTNRVGVKGSSQPRDLLDSLKFVILSTDFRLWDINHIKRT